MCLAIAWVACSGASTPVDGKSCTVGVGDVQPGGFRIAAWYLEELGDSWHLEVTEKGVAEFGRARRRYKFVIPSKLQREIRLAVSDARVWSLPRTIGVHSTWGLNQLHVCDSTRSTVITMYALTSDRARTAEEERFQ